MKIHRTVTEMGRRLGSEAIRTLRRGTARKRPGHRATDTFPK